MEVENNIIKFEDLKGRKMLGAVVSDGESGDFTIAISHNQEHQIKLDSNIPDNKKVTNGNLMEAAQKMIVHWIFEKEGILSDFNISQGKFIDLIKYNNINTIFVKGEEYIIQSKSNESDFHNLVISNDTIREEVYLSSGGSMGSIIYDHGKLLDGEPDGEYLDEETRKEYERVNQSVNGMNDIFEIMADKCTDYRVNKKRLWFDVKRKYHLDPKHDYYYSYGDNKIVNQETEKETEVDEETQGKFFDNLVEREANNKMINMFHNLLTKKERKVVELLRDIESEYDKPIKEINTDTGKIIFEEE